MVIKCINFFNKVYTPCISLVWNYYYNNGNVPGQRMEGSFWWKDILKLLDLFKLWPNAILEMENLHFSGLTYGKKDVWMHFNIWLPILKSTYHTLSSS
jgi:hypothetical protein